jgi:tetratricopeptide (TPR) repeat protein
MITLTIPINDLILSATDDTDLRELPEAEAILRISTAYTFLPPPLSVVIEDDVVEISLAADYQPTPKITRLYEHATTAANRGQYARAIQLYSQYIAEIPTAVDAQRNLGMAHLELGEVDQAEQYILEALKLRPHDPYSLLLIGNIYQKHRQQSDVAEHFCQKPFVSI